MSDELFVDVAGLRRHAGKVRGFGTDADDAVTAADHVRFTTQMFGSIGSELVGPFMDPLQEAGAQSARWVRDSFTSTADIIDGVANGFEHLDNTLGRHVKAIDRAIR